MTVRVKPRAHRDEIRVAEDGSFDIRVTVPPADGAANDKVLRILARHLGIAPSHLEIVSGQRGRVKRIVRRTPGR